MLLVQDQRAVARDIERSVLHEAPSCTCGRKERSWRLAVNAGESLGGEDGSALARHLMKLGHFCDSAK